MHRGFVSRNNNGGVKLRFAFILAEEYYAFVGHCDHLSSMVDKLVLKVL
jgi:hypothetical protein